MFGQTVGKQRETIVVFSLLNKFTLHQFMNRSVLKLCGYSCDSSLQYLIGKGALSKCKFAFVLRRQTELCLTFSFCYYDAVQSPIDVIYVDPHSWQHNYHKNNITVLYMKTVRRNKKIRWYMYHAGTIFNKYTLDNKMAVHYKSLTIILYRMD